MILLPRDGQPNGIQQLSTLVKKAPKSEVREAIMKVVQKSHQGKTSLKQQPIVINFVFGTVSIPKKEDDFSVAPQKLVDGFKATLAKVIKRILRALIEIWFLQFWFKLMLDNLSQIQIVSFTILFCSCKLYVLVVLQNVLQLLTS